MDFAPQRILKILEILLWPFLWLSLASLPMSKLVSANLLDQQRNSVFQANFGNSDLRPHFAGKIQNVTVNVGREAVLECPVNHLGRYKVGWLKAKDQTILALHHRVITHNERFGVDHDDNRIWKLKIRSVAKTDAGCYMCQINTENMKKQVGCIDVLIPPEIDDLKTSSDVHVNEGDEAKLECHANGHPKPKIKWLREDKGNFTVYDRNNKRMIVSDYHGEILKLKRVQRHQMGAYLCIASNTVPPSVSKRIRLNVNFAPEITVSDQLHGVGPGANVTIKCKVEAHPQAINYWMKDAQEMLLKGSKYEISEEDVNEYEKIMRLTIKSWQKADESHFTCISTNSLGKADGKIQAYTYNPKPDPEDMLKRDSLPTPEYFDSSRIQDSVYSNHDSADDLAYQTESEKKSYGGGGGVAHRGSSKNRGHQSDLDEKNQGPNGNPQKSSFGSSFFSNSSNSCHSPPNHLSIIQVFLLLLCLLHTLLVTSSLSC